MSSTGRNVLLTHHEVSLQSQNAVLVHRALWKQLHVQEIIPGNNPQDCFDARDTTPWLHRVLRRFKQLLARLVNIDIPRPCNSPKDPQQTVFDTNYQLVAEQKTYHAR